MNILQNINPNKAQDLNRFAPKTITMVKTFIDEGVQKTLEAELPYGKGFNGSVLNKEEAIAYYVSQGWQIPAPKEVKEEDKVQTKVKK